MDEPDICKFLTRYQTVFAGFNGMVHPLAVEQTGGLEMAHDHHEHHLELHDVSVAFGLASLFVHDDRR